jgi:probable rRNA maturation factor
MEEMNRHYLGHEGSTDVITFDYRAGYSGGESEGADLAGEIFISVADAVSQGEKFCRPWEEEVLRYMVHGVLHLRGYDDLEPVARKKMKAAENRLLKKLLAPAN